MDDPGLQDDMSDRLYVETLTFAQSSNLDVKEHFYQDLCMLFVYEEVDCLLLKYWLLNTYGSLDYIII